MRGLKRSKSTKKYEKREKMAYFKFRGPDDQLPIFRKIEKLRLLQDLYTGRLVLL